LDGLVEAAITDDDVGERSEGRIGHDAAKVEVALEKRRKVLFDSVLDRVVLGIKSLDQDAAGEIAAPGTAGDLREELEGAFGGAEVRHVEGAIGADDADQRNPVEVMTLGEHLRADQNVERARRECAKRFLILTLGARRVAIEPRDAGFGKLLAQALFELLGTFAEKIDVLRIALGTFFRD